MANISIPELKKEVDDAISEMKYIVDIKGTDKDIKGNRNKALNKLVEHLLALSQPSDETVAASKTDAAQLEAKLVSAVDELTDHLQQYSDPSSPKFVKTPEETKFNIVWDLDLCIIKSVQLFNMPLKPEWMTSSVTDREGGVTGKKLTHLDEQFGMYTTVLRGWARFLLSFLKPFCRLHVFTSASYGYMNNVVSVVEAGWPEHLNKEDPKRYSPIRKYKFFEPLRISSTAFESPEHLKLFGKSVLELEPEINKISKECFVTLNNIVLVDDQPRYHVAQPLNGILIKVQEEDYYTLKDDELLKMLPFMAKLVLQNVAIVNSINKSSTSVGRIGSVQKLITYGQTDDYWMGVISQVVKIRAKYYFTEQQAKGKDELLRTEKHDIFTNNKAVMRQINDCLYAYATENHFNMVDENKEEHTILQKSNFEWKNELFTRYNKILADNKKKFARMFRKQLKKVNKLLEEAEKVQAEFEKQQKEGKASKRMSAQIETQPIGDETEEEKLEFDN